MVEQAQENYVLRAVYLGWYRLLCKTPEENTDKYKIPFLAPTRKAAYSIGAATMHSALHISAQQKLEYKELFHDVKSHSEYIALILNGY